MDAVAAPAAAGGGSPLLNLSGRRLTAFDATTLAAAAAVPRPGSKDADTTAAASAVKDQQDRVQVRETLVAAGHRAAASANPAAPTSTCACLPRGAVA